MTAWAGPYLAGCILLVVAGGAKMRAPAATQEVLGRLAGRAVPVPSWAVRAGAVAELALGVTALCSATAGAAMAVALCYATFAGFVMLSLAKGGAGHGCGCFGAAADDVPIGPLHVAVNLLLASAALAVATGGGLPAPVTERAATTVLAAGVAWVIYQVLVPLPRLMAAVKVARR